MRPKSLRDFTGPSKPSGEHINFQICPVCGSDGYKVFVNPETGGWNCFAGRCGAKGWLDVGLGDSATAGGAILDLLHGEPSTPEWEEIELPPWHELTFAAKRYLKRRRIDEETTRALGLVEWEDKSRILFPFFDQQGNLIYWNSRRYSDRLGDGPKYLTAPGKHPLYWLEHSDSERLVIVEGIMDAISVWQAGFSAVALGGKSLPRYLKRSLLTGAAGYGMIDVMLDPDALDAALRLRSQVLDRAGVRVVTLRDKDPGDMAPGEIEEILCT